MAGLLAGIEAGGTKFVCAVGHSADAVLKSVTFPTETPKATFERCLGFFSEAAAEHGAIAAIGVAAFGPVGVDASASDYGVVGRTPKPSWSGASYVDALRPLNAVIGVDSDVNGAALGEWRYGAGQGLRTLAYATVGTGIGAGALKDGRALIGARHAELGHIRPPHDLARDPFKGRCPFHVDCLEGLASGPAILERWGQDLSGLPAAHPAHDLEADYLAQLMLTITLAYAPERIVLGGGVMKASGLIEKVRLKTQSLIGDYIDASGPRGENYIVTPALGDRAGIVGALALAERSLRISV